MKNLRSMTLPRELFDYFVNHLDEVPQNIRRYDLIIQIQVADYVSGMTDRCLKIFASPHPGAKEEVK